MQHRIVALVCGKKRNGWVAHVGIADLISKVSASDSLVSFDHSILMVPELLGRSS
jgi:hypothetical protein